MKYIYISIIGLSIFLIVFLNREKQLESIKDFIYIDNIHISKEDNKVCANIKFFNQSEYDIEIDSYSHAGAEQVFLPTIKVGNRLCNITKFKNPICIPAKSFVIEKFVIDLNMENNSHLDNEIVFCYNIQTWKRNGEIQSRAGEIITLNYTR